MKLSARLIALMASLAGEADPAKRSKLAALMSRKSATLAAKAEKGEDDPDDDGDDDADEDESRAKKAAEAAEKAKKAAKAAGHRAKKAEYLKKAEEAEEAAKMAEEDEEEEESEEEAKAAAALASASGLDAAAIGARLALLGQEVIALKKGRTSDERAALIESVLKQTTKAERADLETWPLAVVKSFVETRRKSGLVYTDEEALVKPKAKGKPGTAEALPEATLALIEQAVAAYPLPDKKEYKATLVAAHLKAHATANGEGRY